MKSTDEENTDLEHKKLMEDMMDIFLMADAKRFLCKALYHMCSHSEDDGISIEEVVKLDEYSKTLKTKDLSVYSIFIDEHDDLILAFTDAEGYYNAVWIACLPFEIMKKIYEVALKHYKPINKKS